MDEPTAALGVQETARVEHIIKTLKAQGEPLILISHNMRQVFDLVDRIVVIRVNGINCGWMDTPGEDAIQRRYHGAGEDCLERAEAARPFGMLVKPDHVAGLASYMLGSGSGVMTGSVVDFDQHVPGSYPE